MFWQKKPLKIESYKDSKEYLERQQKIDYLLVLVSVVQPGININPDILKKAGVSIDKLIEELK